MIRPLVWLSRELPGAFTGIAFGTLIALILTLPLFLVPVAYWVWVGNLEPRHIVEPVLGLILALALAIPCVRAISFHPIFQSNYREWLEATPWRRGLPLPLGSIHPSVGELWCYGVLLAIALALRPYSGLTVSQVFAAVLFPFMGMAGLWTLANTRTGERGLAAVALAIPPIAVTLIHVPRIAWVLLIACPIVAYVGVYRSLALFPWLVKSPSRSPRIDTSNTAIGAKSNRITDHLYLSWPFTALKFEPEEWVQTPAVAAIEAALLGGWVYALSFVLTHLNPPEEAWTFSGLLFVIGLPTGFVALARMNPYKRVICERLCFGWRLGMGQWLVLPHDLVLLVPLAALTLAQLVGLALHYQAGIIPPIATGIGVAVGVFILRAVGPRVTLLYYTGVHNRSPRDNDQSILANRVK